MLALFPGSFLHVLPPRSSRLTSSHSCAVRVYHSHLFQKDFQMHSYSAWATCSLLGLEGGAIGQPHLDWEGRGVGWSSNGKARKYYLLTGNQMLSGETPSVHATWASNVLSSVVSLSFFTSSGGGCQGLWSWPSWGPSKTFAESGFEGPTWSSRPSFAPLNCTSETGVESEKPLLVHEGFWPHPHSIANIIIHLGDFVLSPFHNELRR